MTHSAVTKLLRKEFNIKDDDALIQAYSNMPNSFYEDTYFQKKDFVIFNILNHFRNFISFFFRWN